MSGSLTGTLPGPEEGVVVVVVGEKPTLEKQADSIEGPEDAADDEDSDSSTSSDDDEVCMIDCLIV